MTLHERIAGSEIEPSRSRMLWRSAMAAPPSGLVLEFGVYLGESINLIARTLSPRRVHGFDSFEGIPEDWVIRNDLVYRAGHFGTGKKLPAVDANVTLVPGWFSDTLPGFLEEHAGPASFVNVDCDVYGSTVTLLEALNGRIVPGTVIRFDELVDWTGVTYTKWPEGEYKALEEWISRHGREVEPLFRDEYMGASVRVTR